MKYNTFFFLILICFSCNKRVVFMDEIRPREGSIYYLYKNYGLDFSLSLFGSTSPNKSPKIKTVKNALLNSCTYDISNNQAHYVEDMLLNKNKEGGDNVYQLLQAYNISDSFDIKMFLEDYKTRHFYKGKNVWCSQDSFRKDIIDNQCFYVINYSIKISNPSFTNVIEAFFLKNNYMVRMLFIEKNMYSCDNTRLDYEADRIMSSTKQTLTEASKNKNIVGIHQSFFESKFNYLEPLSRLTEVKEKRVNSESYNELLATYYSFIGDYKNALQYKSKTLQKSSISADTSLIDSFSPVMAANLSDFISDTCRVIMINEDHLNPYCRVFMAKLLKPLFEKGFNCFASETLITRYNSGDYGELKQGTGFYLSEPNYGNLMRSALKTGYKVFSYENDLPYDAKYKVKSSEFREFQQATNISNILKANPKNKIIVFAGHGHIKKKNINGDKLMAEFFKEITGITPFCIDQTVMTESINRDFENPYYVLLEKKYQFKESVIFKRQNEILITPNYKDALDILVFHPRTVYDANNYPLWLLNQGNIKKRFILNDEKYKNAIFQIFKSDESDKFSSEAIPMLNLSLNGANQFDIYLDKGYYYIQICDKLRNILFNESLNLN